MSTSRRSLSHRFLAPLTLLLLPTVMLGQGVTTGSLAGIVVDGSGVAVANATLVATHVPTGTQYRAVSRASGAYTLPNVRVGGPYTLGATTIGFQPSTRQNVFVALGETQRVDFRLERVATQLAGVQVRARGQETEGTRTGAATFVDPLQVAVLPSIKRSTRDLTRLDPRSDGNFSFAGHNWLYNSISLDGSYFSNSFGLDDPAPGGQTGAEPVPFDAVEQVQVSLAPFDVRQGGFTGASINTVTKSGTNSFRASAYSFFRNDAMIGNTVGGNKVVANPSLSYNQSGLSFSGPIRRDKLFYYVNGEIERTEDPGTNFAASRGGASGFGISRVDATTMDAISARLATYGYETGPYEGYTNRMDNNKLLAKLDWNVNSASTFTLRYNYLDAKRDLPPHPFVLSFNNTGRGPNATSLPFRNSGYRMNNRLHSIAAELNSRSSSLANRLFVSYSRFRDFRSPFSAPFPTIEIGEGGVTYTTAGHEPFSIHNILDQDVWQLTDNVTLFRGGHAFTVGLNVERFSFFNSFNIFRNGVFFLPGSIPPGSTFASIADFMQATNPADPNRKDFNAMIGTGPFKGELIDVGQFSIYAGDEYFATPRLSLTYGVRADFPTYFTNPVANPFSASLDALDENGNPETIDQSKLPSAKPIFSPRFGFNWDVRGDSRTRVRGGSGVFTGRVPFVWVGNVISNPGANPNLASTAPPRPTRKGSVLAQSFDLNAMVNDFKWPSTWTTDLAAEQDLPMGTRGILELIYSKDLHNVFMRNADLVRPVRTLPDGRPYYGGAGANELNSDGGAGIYVIDNTSKGYSLNVTGQLRKAFGAANVGAGYSFTDAKNTLKSTEIASVLWQNQPVKGDPNRPEMSNSEFGQRHRLIGDATYTKPWSARFRTQVGAFMEVAEGNRFAGAGGNRYSFIYSGDVNGDGAGGNDLIYIPRSQTDIRFAPLVSGSTTLSPAEQWSRLDAFIQQDSYLSKHRGQIAERFGLVNPWYTNLDMRVLQDIALRTGGAGQQHNLQVSLDLMNVANLLNSNWGVRKVANPTATSPLTLVRFDPDGVPVFNYTGPARTFIDDPDLLSRWRAQIGVKYIFQ